MSTHSNSNPSTTSRKSEDTVLSIPLNRELANDSHVAPAAPTGDVTVDKEKTATAVSAQQSNNQQNGQLAGNNAGDGSRRH